MNRNSPDSRRAARRWLRTLRTIRRRVRDTVPPPNRYLLIVTPLDAALGSPLHVESGGESDGEHWGLLDRAGQVVRQRGVRSLATITDLDEPNPTLATVAWLWLDADGSVATCPPDADEPEGSPDMTGRCSSTDAAMDPEGLFDEHKRSGEPLDETEVSAIVAAHLAAADEFEMRGGGLWWHSPSWSGPDGGADGLPTVEAGDLCPACGGGIVVDATVRYTGIPVYADGTPTDEGEGGDVEWDGDPYCGNCGQRVKIAL